MVARTRILIWGLELLRTIRTSETLMLTIIPTSTLQKTVKTKVRSIMKRSVHADILYMQRVK